MKRDVITQKFFEADNVLRCVPDVLHRVADESPSFPDVIRPGKHLRRGGPDEFRRYPNKRSRFRHQVRRVRDVLHNGIDVVYAGDNVICRVRNVLYDEQDVLRDEQDVLCDGEDLFRLFLNPGKSTTCSDTRFSRCSL